MPWVLEDLEREDLFDVVQSPSSLLSGSRAEHFRDPHTAKASAYSITTYIWLCLLADILSSRHTLNERGFPPAPSFYLTSPCKTPFHGIFTSPHSDPSLRPPIHRFDPFSYIYLVIFPPVPRLGEDVVSP